MAAVVLRAPSQYNRAADPSLPVVTFIVVELISSLVHNLASPDETGSALSHLQVRSITAHTHRLLG